MKKINLGIACAGMIFSAQMTHAQQSVNAAGGDVIGTGGSVAYSIGQPFYRVNGSTTTTSEGVHQPIEITVGIDEQDLDLSMSIFPNPSYDFVHLRIEEYQDQDVSMILIDANGKLLVANDIEHVETQFSVQELPIGTYYLQVLVGQNRFKTFTLLKH